jgi:hypothetical protein
VQFYHPLSQTSRRKRRSDGHVIAEFAPALAILAIMVFIPLLDLTIVPIRWTLAQQLVDDYARKLALCETFSEALATMRAEPSLHQRLEHIGGIQTKALDVQLQISDASETITVSDVGKIPAAWLPSGTHRVCTYTLCVKAQSLLSPAILFQTGNEKIPGLSAPIPLEITASHQWGNLAVDPITRNFYINE